MSTQNPNIPTATQAKGIQATILDIQTHLDTSLVWLTNGMGRAYRLTKVKGNDNTVFLPEVYLGGNQFKYFAATPDNDKKGQSIFVLGSETYLDYKAGWYGQKNYELSIIFSINLKLIDPTLLLTENFARHQIMDVEEALTRGLLGKGYKLVIDNCVTEFDEVFSGFDVSKDYGASLAPMSYFRFNCTVTLDEDCTGVTLDRCGAITQNLSQSDICSCVIPNLDFSESGTDYDCLSETQVSDICDRQGGECYTFFDGTNEHIDFGRPSELIFTKNTAFSGSAWIYKSNTNADVIMANSNSGGQGWQVRNDIIVLNDGASSMQLRISTVGRPLDTWYNFGWSYDGSNTLGGMKYYVDGVLVRAGGTHGAATLPGTIVNSEPITIGAFSSNTFVWDRFIRTVSLYSRELLASEFLAIHGKGMNPTDYNDIPNNIFFTKLSTLNPVDEVLGNNGTSVNMDLTNIICI